MGIYRCYNEDCTEQANGRLGFDFEAGVPVCPKCKCDGRKPEFASMINELPTTHLVVKDKAGPIITSMGRRRIACMPTSNKYPERATDLPSAVNCSACKESKYYASTYYVDAANEEPAGNAPEPNPVVGQKLAEVMD